MNDDYDSPWKEILEGYFPDFMAFFFPLAATEIDWSRGFELLDKELAQVVRDAELGRRYADKLIAVYLLDGAKQWLLIHIEVQGQRDDTFAERMFVYAYRIYDRYACEIVSLAVLADTSPGWCPSNFEIGRWGSCIGIEFPTVKLLDYGARTDALAQDPNPFAIVVLAHQATQATRGDPQARLERKLGLTRSLYQRGLTRQKVIDLYCFIDWILRLPDELEHRFTDTIHQIEEALGMPYVSFAERRGEARGAARALRTVLEKRFGRIPDEVDEHIGEADANTLANWLDQALDAASLDEVFRDGASPPQAR